MRKSDSILPTKERLEKGPIAIIECSENIPCDPCKYFCKSEAILKKDLVDPPVVNWDKCTGCGICVTQCPGLAIFVIDLSLPGDKGLVTIPYEFSPLPKEGEEVIVLDGEGRLLGTGKVVNIKMAKNRTLALTVAVNKKIAPEVRNIRRKTQ